MKKTIHFAAVGLLLAGVLFKIMHWPGANALIVLGSAANLVSGILHHGAGKAEGDSGTPYLLLTAALSTTILGALFKIMHWEGADIIGVVSMFLTLSAIFVLASKPVHVSSSYVSSYLLAMFVVFAMMKNSPLSALNLGEESEEPTTEQTQEAPATPSTDSAAKP